MDKLATNTELLKFYRRKLSNIYLSPKWYEYKEALEQLASDIHMNGPINECNREEWNKLKDSCVELIIRCQEHNK